MNLSLSEEQVLLQSSIARFVAENYEISAREKLVASDTGFSPEYWKQYADLGWLALPFSEQDGGLGGTAVDLMVLMEQFGRGLVLEPYISTVVLGGGFLCHAAEARKSELLPRLMAGEVHCAFAGLEAQGRHNLACVNLSAEEASGGWVLKGDKTLVLNGPAADFFVVSARTCGQATDEQGISLFLVPADAKGVSRRDYPTIDGQRASELSLQGVAVGADDLIGEKDQGHELQQQILCDALLALGAEAVGCISVMQEDTVEFSRTREQFGLPIGSFQVLQHRMVDMFMELEQSRSILYMAAVKVASAQADKAQFPSAAKATSALKAQIGKAGQFVGQQAVQTHGGMGVTEELRLGHYFKRITAIEHTFGNTDYHLRRFASL